jgi:hypothetical protein
LHVSDDGGSSWTQLWEAADDGGQWGWRPVTIDLSDYTTRDEIHLAWQYVGNDGDFVGVDAVIVRAQLPAEGPIQPPVPKGLYLGQNSPNPFSASTTICFWIPETPEQEHVTLRVYDIHGRLVRTLLDGPAAGGHTRVPWHGTNRLDERVPAGTYFYRLEMGGTSRTKRLVVYR